MTLAPAAHAISSAIVETPPLPMISTLLPSRTGIEFVDMESEHWDINHWVRGGCIYGIMPCNGLVYAPPHDCACYTEAKLRDLKPLHAEVQDGFQAEVLYQAQQGDAEGTESDPAASGAPGGADDAPLP